MSGQSEGLTTLIDCTTFGDADITDSGSGTVLQGKSVNYTVTDASGTGFSGVKVAIYDTDGTIQDALRTSSSGAVGEIVTIFNRYVDSAPSLNKAPFDIRIRKYGYVYQGFQSAVSEPIKQEVRLAINSRLVSTEAQAAAIAGISLNFATSTATLTADHNAQSLYDYYQYQLNQTANLAYGEELARSGADFDLSDWALVVDGCTYSGNITTTGAITRSNGGIIIGVSTDGAGSTTVAPLTVTVKDATGSVIEGARVFIFPSGGGATILTGLTNSSGILTGTYTGSTPQAVEGWVRKSTLPGTLYKQFAIAGSIETAGFSVTALMTEDE